MPTAGYACSLAFYLHQRAARLPTAMFSISHFVQQRPVRCRSTSAAAAAVVLAAAALAACGGGGDSSAPAVAEPLLGDNTTTATRLATETRRALSVSQGVAGLPVPSAGAVLSAVLTGNTTVACPFGGSWSHNVPPLPLPGVTYQLSFAQCAFVDQQAYQGNYTVSYSNFTSLDAVRWAGNFNLAFTAPGQPLRQLVGTHECATQSNTVACTVNDGERVYSGSFSYAGDRIQGSYSWRFGTGADTELTLNYANWTAAGGTATVTGPGGFSATVVRTGANSFSVSIKGGVPYSITLTG